MRVLLLMLLAIKLCATSISTHSLYPREGFLDLMLSFTQPYDGDLEEQSKGLNYQIILPNLKASSVINRNPSSPFLELMSIESKGTFVVLSFTGKSPLNIEASRTPDRFGMRIRVEPVLAANAANAANSGDLTKAASTLNSDLGMSDDGDIIYKFLGLLGFLFLLFFFLLFLKKKLGQSTNRLPLGMDKLDILYQKPLDRQNRFVVLSYAQQRYLLVLGSSNLLLDRLDAQGVSLSTGAMAIKEEAKDEQEGFELYFQENKNKIQSAINKRSKGIQGYKERLDARHLEA